MEEILTSPKTLFTATIVAMVAALICIAFLIWNNATSRNIALAGGTVFAAAVLFFTQLFFELQRSETNTLISTEFTVDRQLPSIRQWNYEGTPGSRIGVELAASELLAKSNPAAFNGDRAKLISDLALYSVLGYLGREQFDWQLDRIALSGQTYGQETQWQRRSKPDECTEFSPDMLAKQLAAAGNQFAGSVLWVVGGSLCLPPKTSLTVALDHIEIANSFCNILFKTRQTGGVSNVRPLSGGEVVSLPNSESRYETRLTGLEVTTIYHALRAQNRQLPKYRAWAERVVAGAAIWFGNER